MPIRIRLTKDKDSIPEKDVVLNNEVISIGRETGNTLQIAGTLVSKKHAKIEGSGNTYHLVDLRSTNSTFLNDEKLPADKQHKLHLGDHIRIGEYMLEIAGFGEQQSAVETLDRKATFSQPSFADLEKQVAQFVQQFADPAYQQNRLQLKHVLADLIGRLEASDVDDLVSNLKGLQTECERLKNENVRLQQSLEDVRKQVERQGKSEVQPQIASNESVSTQGLTRTMRTFLDALTRLVRGRNSFRSEFMYATMVSDGELSPLLSGSTEAGMRFLFEGSASDWELAEHNAALQRALDEVVFHVVGLLEGYRTSVDDGMKMLLQVIDPEVFKKQLLQSKLKVGPLEIPYRLVPFLVEWKAMKMSAGVHRELTREDRGVLEKRYFRPAFVRGYEKCILSIRGVISEKRTGSEMT